MTIRIKHTHGITETHGTLSEALSALREVYGEDIAVYGPDGGPLEEPSLRMGRALVWQDEASSVDDDGARAVASLWASAE
jgi:hypothetical protein